MNLRTRLSLQIVIAVLALYFAPARAENYAFAVSWQAQFCELKKDKPECKSMTPTRFDAKNFTLHGLWPQSADYCGATEQQKKADGTGDWKSLPEVVLKPEVAVSLAEAMPGTASMLERHEWVKHGACANSDADEYFSKAFGLLAQLNISPLGKHVARRYGSDTSMGKLQQLAELSFGPASKTSIEYICDARKNSSQALVEIRFHMGASGIQGLDLNSSLNTPVRMAKATDLCVGGPVFIDGVNED